MKHKFKRRVAHTTAPTLHAQLEEFGVVLDPDVTTGIGAQQLVDAHQQNNNVHPINGKKEETAPMNTPAQQTHTNGTASTPAATVAPPQYQTVDVQLQMMLDEMRKSRSVKAQAIKYGTAAIVGVGVVTVGVYAGTKLALRGYATASVQTPGT